jgi:hypothetical protein
MSIEDSVDQLFSTAELFGPDPDRQPSQTEIVLYRMSDDLSYPALISALSWPGEVGQRLTVFPANGPAFNVSAVQGDGVGEWRYGD